ncbi:MAG: peptidylprolyl isomerase [Candidatus Methanofastidiosa archaeon]|nr:peptidylprolyl isomerase [Candidatus Methanofastidiosa archaeon]
MNTGAFVEIDYVAKVKDGRYFDVTDEARAKELDLYEQGRTYGPVKVVVGARHVLEGLDEALASMELGEEREVVVSPEQGFGRRDPSLINTVPMREFRKQGITPRVGMSLEVGEQVAHVKSVSSGRVTLDFNHALAGRTLEYTVRIVSEITDPQKKIEALFDLYLGGFDESKYTVAIEGTEATITMEGLKKGVEDVVRSIVRKEIEKHIPEITAVSFGGEESPEEPPEGEAQEQAGDAPVDEA